jgi:hypothetical protein
MRVGLLGDLSAIETCLCAHINKHILSRDVDPLLGIECLSTLRERCRWTDPRFRKPACRAHAGWPQQNFRARVDSTWTSGPSMFSLSRHSSEDLLRRWSTKIVLPARPFRSIPLVGMARSLGHYMGERSTNNGPSLMLMSNPTNYRYYVTRATCGTEITNRFERQGAVRLVVRAVCDSDAGRFCDHRPPWPLGRPLLPVLRNA